MLTSKFRPETKRWRYALAYRLVLSVCVAEKLSSINYRIGIAERFCSVL